MENVCQICKSETPPNKDDTLVFCCECRRAYHRLCHKPPVARICIEVLDVLWFCKSLAGHHAEQGLGTGVASTELTSETRKAYLSSLTKTQLIHLLQFAETLQPSLPIYPPNTQSYVEQIEQENEDIRQMKYQIGPGNEDLLVSVINDYANAHKNSPGLTIQQLWKELETTGKVERMNAVFKHSTTRALQRALRKCMILERNGNFLPNPDFQATSELYLTQLLKADDKVIFEHIPSRVAESNHHEVEKGDVFSHRIYMV